MSQKVDGKAASELLGQPVQLVPSRAHVLVVPHQGTLCLPCRHIYNPQNNIVHNTDAGHSGSAVNKEVQGLGLTIRIDKEFL